MCFMQLLGSFRAEILRFWSLIALGARLPVRVSRVGPMVKHPPANAGEAGSIPGSERSLEEEMTTFSSILTSPGNPMDAGAWWAAVHGVTESQTQFGE